MVHIDGYSELKPIGHGGFSTVYASVQQVFDRLVAVKVLHATLAAPEAQRRFVRECRALGRVGDHPNIVTVFDAGATDDARPYLAMEYLPRGSVADLLARRGPLAPASVCRIGARVADALAHAHARDILHRDLKPANILLRADGGPVLSDFGIASLPADLAGETYSAAYTPSYAAPEVLADATPSTASDLYSLGATLFVLLTGRPPYGADGGPVRLHSAIMRGPAPTVERDDVPAELAELIRRLLSADAGARAGSAAAVAADLAAIETRLAAAGASPDLGADPDGEDDPSGAPTAAVELAATVAHGVADARSAAAAGPAEAAATMAADGQSPSPPIPPPPTGQPPVGPGQPAPAAPAGGRRSRLTARWLVVTALAGLVTIAFATMAVAGVFRSSPPTGPRPSASPADPADPAAPRSGQRPLVGVGPGPEPLAGGVVDPMAPAAPPTGPVPATVATTLSSPATTAAPATTIPATNPATSAAPTTPAAPGPSNAPAPTPSASPTATPTCRKTTATMTDYKNRKFTTRYACSTAAGAAVYGNVRASQTAKLDDTGYMNKSASVWVICQFKGRANPAAQGKTNVWWLYTQADAARANSVGYSHAWGYLPATVVVGTTSGAAVRDVPTCPSYY
jgi:hypothetical protein